MLHVSTARVLVTTTETVPGYQIVQILGPVIGVAARTSSPYHEGFKSMNDGHPVDSEHRRELLAGCRMDAIRNMLEHADGLGANAVVAMRFDHRSVTDLWNEICAYGTAVRVRDAGAARQFARQRSAAERDSVA